MNKIKVRVSFQQVVTFTKEIEMEYSEYVRLSEDLDRERGRRYREIEEDLFARMNFTDSDAHYGANDPELAYFEQVTSQPGSTST